MTANLKTVLFVISIVMLCSTSGTKASPLENAGLKFVGEGKMSFLFWDVYLARLYTSSGTYQPGLSPLALEFNYLMGISADDLIEETINQWREQKIPEHSDEKIWAEQLKNIWPDVVDGDQLLFVIDENFHSHFYHNQTLVGTIEAKAFSEHFSAIWLSDKTTAPKVRKKLLGD